MTRKIKFSIKKFSRTGDDKLEKLLGETDIGHSFKDLLMLVKAQLWSIHHLLLDDDEWDIDQFEREHYQEKAFESDTHYEDYDGTRTTKSDRVDWLQRVKATPNLYHCSNRLSQFDQVYKNMRTILPHRKIVVVTQFVMFLDIVAEVLKRDFNVKPLRYDGAVPERKRPKVLQDFKTADPKVPLLWTAGTDSFGLDLTCASIFIQTEIWWNKNDEPRVGRRAWAPGQQPHEILHIRLLATDSPIANLMLRVQTRKDNVNSDIMEAILRHPEQQPDIRKLREPVVLPPLEFPEPERAAH
jgi:SNF2 family DNA or RNA helicase